ncbi:putative necrosis-inducing factor-domain-containing protein [Hypoxylon fuscum]|nr:putative necrosis-inducing factor-domain-containing protein [Hypoxylon fuscum]
MLHNIILPAFIFSALIAAMPSLFDRQDACATGTSAGYCETLSYNDRTDSSSPSSADCQQTCRSILTDAGDWGVDFNGQPAGYRDNLVLSDCPFGIERETDGDSSSFSFSVHNQDIIDVVGQSINKFAGNHGGKVKAEGTMKCDGHTVRWYVG